MPVATNLISAPLLFIDQKFTNHSSQEQAANGSSFHRSVIAPEAEKFPSISHDIPLLSKFSREELNVHNNTIVRFRCLIQDMAPPEFYFSRYDVISASDGSFIEAKTGLFRDSMAYSRDSKPNFESPNNETAERYIYRGVPIPNEAEWMKKVINETMNTNSSRKRKASEADMDDVSGATKSDGDDTNMNTEGDATKLKSEQLDVITIKIYDEAISEQIKLNECFEVYGILYSSEEAIDDNDEEMETNDNRNLQSKNNPKIHALHLTKLYSHANPLVDRQLISQPPAFNIIRSELIADLTPYCLGDSVAAEYLLYHLISSIYARQSVLPIGKFSLNLYNFPTPTFGEENTPVESLKKFLEAIVTKFLYIPMSIEFLNGQRFIPKKNYQTDTLDTGLLQISDGTQLLIDEIKLSAGKLEEQGLRNVMAMREMIQWQKLDYDFQYHTSEFLMNVNCLICSEGKSCLGSDYEFPLEFPADIVPNQRELPADFVPNQRGVPAMPNEKQLNIYRWYLSAVRNLDYNISEEIRQVVQDKFVDMRQKDSQVCVENLHQLLALARLISLSNGEKNLAAESWHRAVTLEGVRSTKNKKMKEFYENKREEQNKR